MESNPNRMTLLELRRYAIRQRIRIHFTAPPAGECVVNEHGLIKIPSLRAMPDFNVEALLGSVEYFLLDPLPPASKRQKISRQQLQALLSEAPQGAKAAHED